MDTQSNYTLQLSRHQKGGIYSCPLVKQEHGMTKTSNELLSTFINPEAKPKQHFGKWYYLCIVMNLFSRKVIAWNISAKPDVDLVMTAFKKAYDKRDCPKGLMFHSDRGSQYTAFAFFLIIVSTYLTIVHRPHPPRIYFAIQLF